jgi:hypothetical protein
MERMGKHDSRVMRYGLRQIYSPFGSSKYSGTTRQPRITPSHMLAYVLLKRYDYDN